MRELSAWHYLVILTVPCGIFVSLRFGVLGLSIFTLINLAISYFIPDGILNERHSGSVQQEISHPLENPNKTQEATFGLALGLPIISLILVWVFSPEVIAAFLLKLSLIHI